MVERQLPKLHTRVRFPSPAPNHHQLASAGVAAAQSSTMRNGRWRAHSVAGKVTMGKARLEAFTDGVIAIIITIMVLEMKVPHGSDFSALAESTPVLLAYVLSFT